MTSAAIIGVGEVPCGRYPERTPLDMAIAVVEEALADAQVERRDVDAILVAPCFCDPWFNTDLGFARLVDELGMRGTARLNAQVMSGGTTGTTLLKTATAMIEAGQVETVLCLHVEKFTNLSGQEGFDFFAKAGIEKSFEAPFGMSYNALPAFTAQRFMYETDTTEEQIAAVSVACREWSALHPNAMHRKPLTVEDVIASKMVATPMRALMLNALGDGGSGFVVTTHDRATSLGSAPAYVWGEGDIVSTYSFAQHDDITRMNWSVAGDRAFAQAGITPADIDVLEIYIAYPIFHLIIMEELGFCARGTAGAFVADGHTRPGGKLPTSTYGDAMSYGHIGAGVGVATLVETYRQLAGKAGERQVHDASIALKTGAGGAYADAHVTILGKEPR
jgi:acetyl-CoA acetyltransferase